MRVAKQAWAWQARCVKKERPYIYIADGWKDYALLDTGDGEKLERWGDILTIRPDPQIIWPRLAPERWRDYHMRYNRSQRGGGHWEHNPAHQVPERWTIRYHGEGLTFRVRPTDFKHMGLFPEQAANWQWASARIRDAGRPVRLLNLFAYTGGATIAALNAGATVTHVDAAKGMNAWAKENIALSGLETRPHRVLTDDVFKFVSRESRRGHFYDAVIMDPPSYGRGPSGELWKLEARLFALVCQSVALLSDQPLFFLLNMYAAGLSPAVAENILTLALARRYGQVPGRVYGGELGLRGNGLCLPCGLFGRWEPGV